MPAEISKRTICVAGAQMPVTDDIDSNVAAITRAIEFATSKRARILLTPEGSLSGYTHKFNLRAVKKALSVVTAEARKAGLGLALGTCFVEPGDKRCYNQIRFYSPDGRYLGFHSKILTCSTLKKPFEGEIRHFSVSPMRIFNFEGISIGGLICNDLWANPLCTPQPDKHLSQRLSRMGSRIIFHAVNGARTGDQWSRVAWHFHDANLRMRARAARVWIVTVDKCSPADLRCSSQAGVISPEGEWACRAEPKGEQCFAFTINLADQRTKQ
jgi:predicted amidohydrolase